MSTLDFIIELFCRVDEVMGEIPKHTQAHLYPSELVTLALLRAIKGGPDRAFYRWLRRDYQPLFPGLPERSRLFRLFQVHQAWADYFLAEPTILAVVDCYGIELVHPWREGRTERFAEKGLSNHRWIVGGKFCFILNQFGRIVNWACDSANVSDTSFQDFLREFEGEMVILADSGFHAKQGDPDCLKICKRGSWNVRMLVETVLSMLTTVCHLKKMTQRYFVYFQARLAFISAAYNLLVDWNGLGANQDGLVQLSIAQFSL